ncbi:MAG: amidase family protein, partial [Chthoniobacter sp.]|uniref:amidase family protein n=1 Tax=Chthoniobacter sp. TaxID=2510640 RepID=UPI0032A3D30E
MELTALSIAGLQQKLRAKEVSPTEVVRALEARIGRVDPQIHGYLSRDFDAALKIAESADVSLPLGGVPIAIKDVINVTGEPCT